MIKNLNCFVKDERDDIQLKIKIKYKAIEKEPIQYDYGCVKIKMTTES